jgi:hypothetical protein
MEVGGLNFTFLFADGRWGITIRKCFCWVDALGEVVSLSSYVEYKYHYFHARFQTNYSYK